VGPSKDPCRRLRRPLGGRDEHKRVGATGGRATDVIDRFWFKSVYFKEPGGVLFEIATEGPGFAVDEDPAHLGESLVLPPWFEPSRAEIERVLPTLTMPPRQGSGQAAQE